MTAVVASAEKLMSADEFWALPPSRRPTELVRGRVVSRPVPGPRHGQVCGRVDRLIGNFVDQNNLGHVLT
ncbi:MAG TPA: hypothetical protein VK137_21410, partial [Planctomycetaceae bacterium]|nr:hypothetical protein [Planctomycetaceae bacterium]